MKRSEMVDAIKGDLARMDLDFLHGRNLDKIPYHVRVEMLTQYFLMFAERYGMLPPPTSLDCVTESLLYCYYPKIEEKEGNWEVLDKNKSQLWEPEDE